ncbi:putative GNAT family acetyltransferase [Thozetella sp. PMI_491]|nr:putative GNAT family acetyltransferase [Thozetella sp. PMI_491]
MTIELRQAKQTDIAAIVQVGCAAFDPALDAIVRRLFPAHLQPGGQLDEDRQAKWLTRRLAGALDSPDAVLMVAEEGTEIVGAALWVAPHAEDDKGDAGAPQPPRVPPPNMDREAAGELRGVLTRSAVAALGDGGSDNAWELDFLAVDPKQQRRGIGKSLVTWGMEKAKQASKDCYLVATSDGLPLYLAVGFEGIGELEIFGIPHTQMVIRNDPKWTAAAGHEQ